MSLRFQADPSLRRFGAVVIGGAPLRLFQMTPVGGQQLDELLSGQPVAASALTMALWDAGAIHPVWPDSTHRPDEVTVVTPILRRDDRSRLPHRSPGEHGARATILVDDGSDPAIPGADVRLDHNSGPAAARNAGLDLVTTELVAFVDDDVEVTPGWLTNLLGHFDDPAVAIVAPRVRSGVGATLLQRYERDSSPLDMGSRPANVRPGSSVAYVPSAAMVCRTAAIRSIGGFDETLRVGEDVDLVWRLIDAGWKVRYEPGCSVHHRPRPSWPAWWRQRVTYGSSATVLADRFGAYAAPARVNIWGALAWLLAVGAQPWLAIGVALTGGARFVAKLDRIPPGEAVVLAGRGLLATGDQLATATRRGWWPILLLGVLWSGRRGRRSCLRALVASAIAARSPLRLADDVAYSVGVWQGMVKARSLAALLPVVNGWRWRWPAADDR